MIFYSGGYPDENDSEKVKGLYTVGTREDSNQFKELRKIAEKNNETIYYNERNCVYCFRITEEQSNELMKPYIKIREKSKENIKKVTYTYNKLFGEFEKPKKVISDILNWKRPTKEVFEKYGFKIEKVELDGNYPILYVKYNENSIEEKTVFEKISQEIFKANGYWDFKIVDEVNKFSVSITGDKKSKKIVKIEYK